VRFGDKNRRPMICCESWLTMEPKNAGKTSRLLATWQSVACWRLTAKLAVPMLEPAALSNGQRIEAMRCCIRPVGASRYLPDSLFIRFLRRGSISAFRQT